MAPRRWLAWVSLAIVGALVALLAWWGGSMASAPPTPAPSPVDTNADSNDPAGIGIVALSSTRDGVGVTSIADQPTPGALSDSIEPGNAVVVVSDIHGAPVGGAVVEITGGGPLGSHTADASGRCPIPVKPARNSVELLVSAAGFVPYGVTISRSTEIKIQLARAVRLRGRVVDAANEEGLPNATVAVEVAGARGYRPQTKSSGDGSFELTGAPEAQESTWVLAAEGYATLCERRVVIDSAFEVEFRLKRGIELSFDVVDCSTGLPVAGAHIQRQSGEVLSDYAGRVTTSSLISADDSNVELQVTAPGFCRLNARVTRGDFGSKQPLRLPLLRAAVAEGRVLAAEGPALPDAEVRLTYDPLRWRTAATDEWQAALPLMRPSWFMSPLAQAVVATTDSEGRFRLEGQLPGPASRRLSVVTAESVRVERAIDDLGAPGPITTIEIRVPARGTAGTVTGKVTLNDEPLMGWVDWKGATRQGSAFTETDGRYWLERVECGNVLLTLRPVSAHSVRCRAALEATRQVDVAPDAEVRLDLQLALPASTIAGHVRMPDGRPAAQVEVIAHDRAACWDATSNTDDQGAFSLRVDASAADFRVSAGSGAAAAFVEHVAPGTEGLEIRLRGTATCRVRVVDSDSQEPLSQFMLTFVGDDDARVFDTHMPRPSNALIPEAEGWFRVEMVQGRFRLEVSDPLARRTQYLPTEIPLVEIGPDGASIEVQRERGVECILQLAPGVTAWTQGEFTVFLVEASLFDEVEHDSSGWSFGPGFAHRDVLRSLAVRPDESGRARVGPLHRGPLRFKIVPPTMRISPEAIESVPTSGAPVIVSWSREPAGK